MLHIERSEAFSESSFMLGEYAIQIACFQMADVPQTVGDHIAGSKLVASSWATTCLHTFLQ